jgi:hypothetical protein
LEHMPEVMETAKASMERPSAMSTVWSISGR